jgi:hypothetical protein
MPYRIRASYAKGVLDALRRTPHGGRIVAALGDTAHRIDGHIGTSLIPGEDIDQVVAVALEVGGEACLTEASRQHMVGFRDTPLMRPLVDAVVRLSGMTPHAILRIVPRARATLVTDAGTLEYFRLGNTEARLEVRGLPGKAVPQNAIHLRGGWLGVLDVCHVQGTVSADVVDVTRGNIDFAIRWT